MNNTTFQKIRNDRGVYQIKCDNMIDYSKAIAEIHCEDRFLQMEMVRIISKGTLSQYLKADDETLEIDIFMKKLGFHNDLDEEIESLTTENRDFLNAYVDSVNEFISKGKFPFEFKLVGHKPPKWKLTDIMATIRIMSYIGLSQTQEDMEKFIIKVISLDFPIEKLKTFFNPLLDNINNETVDMLKNLKFKNLTVPNLKKYHAPSIKNSNNWVLSKEITKEDHVIMCSDPHLEVNRLPGIWYEYIAKVGERNFMGISMPGIPGLIMGRNDQVSFSFTYGFMDLVDFFIEDIKDNKILRDGKYVELDLVTETIVRKGKEDYLFSYYKKDGCSLESENFVQKNCLLEDGYYLSKAWYGKKGVGNSLNSLYDFHQCDTADQLQESAKKISISCNWLIGDLDNIIYQQSGQLPNRNSNGIVPIPGWIKGNIDLNKSNESNLMNIKNPKSGFLCTANNNILQKEKPISINLPMGSYRYDRIRNLLSERKDHTCESLKDIQTDLYSIQAEKFLTILLPLIENENLKNKLQEWSKCYKKDLIEPFYFEVIYRNIIKDTVGRFFGLDSWDEIVDQTPILVDFYHFADNLILNEKLRIEWFSDKETFQSFMLDSLRNSIKQIKRSNIKNYGEFNSSSMNNIFFDGKLPKILGFDYGPINLEGSRATIVQGAVFTSHGRNSSFCPSWRFITDMNSKWAYSILAGGVSDRRFSKLYKSEVKEWLEFKYKKISFIQF